MYGNKVIQYLWLKQVKGRIDTEHGGKYGSHTVFSCITSKPTDQGQSWIITCLTCN